jgi:hypothetical protein
MILISHEMMTDVMQVWEMHRLLNEGIASGEVQPLPWTVFARSKAQDAFRYLAGGAQCLASECCLPSVQSAVPTPVNRPIVVMSLGVCSLAFRSGQSWNSCCDINL